jgi:hypothetical protein
MSIMDVAGSAAIRNFLERESVTRRTFIAGQTHIVALEQKRDALRFSAGPHKAMLHSFRKNPRKFQEICAGYEFTQDGGLSPNIRILGLFSFQRPDKRSDRLR